MIVRFTIQSLLLFSLLCVVGMPISLRGELQTAHAVGAGIIVSDIENTLTNTIQTLAATSLEQKELTWDALFYAIAKKALQQMTNDIISWVNSGFDGNPAFITDLAGYLQDLADDVAGDLIYGADLNTLCTPFQYDVRTAVAKAYQQENHIGVKKDVECSIDDISGGDAQAFLRGDFNAGGWGMWFEAVLNPENTPIGGYAMVDLALQDAINKKQSEKLHEADYNQGFLSQEVCTPVAGGEVGEEKCTVTTPGIIIKDQLSFALTTPARSLIEADEMNEVIGALFSNLAQQAFTGVNGLLGLGGNASFSDNSFGDGSSSYLDVMQQESDESGNVGDITGNKIAQALRTETDVLDLEDQILAQLDELTTAYTDAKEPFEGDSCWDLEFPASLGDTVDELVERIPETIATIIKLEDLSNHYDEAGSSSEQLQILQEFTALQSSGAIAGQTAFIEYQYYINNELKNQVEDFQQEIEDELTSC